MPFSRACVLVSNSRESLKGARFFRFHESFADLYETRDPLLSPAPFSGPLSCFLLLHSALLPPFEGAHAQQEGQLGGFYLLRQSLCGFLRGCSPSLASIRGAVAACCHTELPHSTITAWGNLSPARPPGGLHERRREPAHHTCRRRDIEDVLGRTQ